MYKSINNTLFVGSGSTSLIDCKAASTALVKCTCSIVESKIDPIDLARELFSKQIISENVYDRVRDEACRDTNKTRLEIILDDLRSRVKYKADILTIFVKILREKFKKDDLADEILSNLPKV